MSTNTMDAPVLVYRNQRLSECQVEKLCEEFDDYQAASILQALSTARYIVDLRPVKVEIREGILNAYTDRLSRHVFVFEGIEELSAYQYVFNQQGWKRVEKTTWDGIWVDYRA